MFSIRKALSHPAKPCFNFKTPFCAPAKPCFNFKTHFRKPRHLFSKQFWGIAAFFLVALENAHHLAAEIKAAQIAGVDEKAH